MISHINYTYCQISATCQECLKEAKYTVWYKKRWYLKKVLLCISCWFDKLNIKGRKKPPEVE